MKKNERYVTIKGVQVPSMFFIDSKLSQGEREALERLKRHYRRRGKG